MAIATRLNGLKKEFVNNAYMADFVATNGKVIPDFSGYAYEHKYHLQTLNKIQNLINNKQQHIKEMKKQLSDCKISYATCRFYFRDLDVSLDTQKELLKLQTEIFSDVTVQMVNFDLANFKSLLDFAKSLDMPISTLIDLKQRHEDELIDTVKFIAAERNNITYTKWIYGKMDSWLRKYKIVRDTMNRIEMPKVLVGCDKRCGIENFKEIIVPMVALAHFGFNASCMDYSEKTTKSRGRFTPSTDVFNSSRWEYEKQPLIDYRSIRISNLKEINKAIDSINLQEIAKRPRVQALFQKLVKLEAQ